MDLLAGASTTQLLRYLHMCIEKIMNGGVVDTIYLDFAQAFDNVPHRRLIGKLESYDVSGNILNLITAFLSGRSQVVKVNGVESESIFVLSGIPHSNKTYPYGRLLLADISSYHLHFIELCSPRAQNTRFCPLK